MNEFEGGCLTCLKAVVSACKTQLRTTMAQGEPWQARVQVVVDDEETSGTRLAVSQIEPEP